MDAAKAATRATMGCILDLGEYRVSNLKDGYEGIAKENVKLSKSSEGVKSVKLCEGIWEGCRSLLYDVRTPTPAYPRSFQTRVFFGCCECSE